MDYGTFRGVYTIIMLIVVIGIIWWAYSRHNKSNFDDAANSIFDEDKDKKDKQHLNEDKIDKE